MTVFMNLNRDALRENLNKFPGPISRGATVLTRWPHSLWTLALLLIRQYSALRSRNQDLPKTQKQKKCAETQARLIKVNNLRSGNPRNNPTKTQENPAKPTKTRLKPKNRAPSRPAGPVTLTGTLLMPPLSPSPTRKNPCRTATCCQTAVLE
jgi:hypothetical protein